MEFLIVFGGCVMALGIAYIVTAVLPMRSFQGAGSWPKTEGKVLRAFIYKHERRTPAKTSVTYTPVVEYAYTVDEVGYTSQQRSFAPARSFEDEAEAQKVVDEFAVGSDVKVRYNVNFPQQASLSVPKPMGHTANLFYGIVNVVMGALMIALAIVLMRGR